MKAIKAICILVLLGGAVTFGAKKPSGGGGGGVPSCPYGGRTCEAYAICWQDACLASGKDAASCQWTYKQALAECSGKGYCSAPCG